METTEGPETGDVQGSETGTELTPAMDAETPDEGGLETAHGHQHGPAMNPELVREIEVGASAEDVSASFRAVTKRYAKLARIPGFRTGKVPESVVRSKFAKEIRQEVLDGLVSARFREALKEQAMRPVSEPQISELMLVDGQPLRFKARFEVMPEVDLTGYETVAVTRPDAALTEAEFEGERNRALDSHAVVETVEEDRPMVDGDWAEIEFKGVVKELAQTVGEDGLTAEGAAEPEPITGEDVMVEVGSTNTLPAFNEALRGAKAGQELTFEVDYPADFGEARLAGQTVAYDVTVKAIKKKTFPERDAEFAKQLGPYDSWEAFEAGLRERASGRKKDALESQAKDAMLGQFLERYQFAVPESFVQQQIEARLDRGLRALAQQGMTAEQMRKLDFAGLREAQREQAVNEVKASMILDRLAELEQVTVSEEDLERELLMMSIQQREPMETLRERMAKDGSLERMGEQMRRERTGSVVFERLAG